MSRRRVKIAQLTNKWTPHPGAQTAFHNSKAFEVLYGGAAGGGKTESLLLEALTDTDNPGYRAIIFRRTYPELEGKGSGVIPRSRELLAGKGAIYDESKQLWTFPSGATLAFAHLEHEHTVHNYRSAQFAYIAFDELTTFTESQYLYLFSRCRSVAAVPARIRAATNPGGIGHSWVRRRFIEKLKPFEIRYFKREGDEEIETHRRDRAALSRQFIPARLRDNPTLMRRDPDYKRRLLALDAVDRARLLDGDWFAANAGLVYSNFTDANITDDAPDPHHPVELAFDDGYIDRRALLLIQRTDSRILVFAELYHAGHLPETCINELRELCKIYNVPFPHFACGSHEAVELRERLRRAGIYPRQNMMPLVEGITLLRRLICDASNVRVLQVHRRCKNLLAELREGYHYDPRGGELPVDRDNHACDALRMWAWERADVHEFAPFIVHAPDPLEVMDRRRIEMRRKYGG